jgi:hypothetical protein
MKQGTKDEKRLIQYLLGQMRPDEEARIEERYVADPEFHQELRATERDLIDRYVHGELSNPEAFEKHFLSSPSRRQKVEFARALMHSLAHAPAAGRVSTPPERDSWTAAFRRMLAVDNRAWQLVAATLVLLVGGGLLFLNWRTQQPSTRVPQIAQQPDQGTPRALGPPTTAQPDVPPAQPSQPAPQIRVATFILTPSLTRDSDQTPTLTFERDADVRLQLHLDSRDYTRYRALLRTPEGEAVWTGDRLTPERAASGQAIVVRLPAARFSSQDYIIRLEGVTVSGEFEEVASYYFRVQTK